MQLATMLEPALVSPSPAPVRRLSSVMRRLVRCVCGWCCSCQQEQRLRRQRMLCMQARSSPACPGSRCNLGLTSAPPPCCSFSLGCSLFPPALPSSEAPKTAVADLASKLQLRLQEYINRWVGGAAGGWFCLPVRRDFIALMQLD